MNEKRHKNSYYGSAVVFFIFALLFISRALQGHSMIMWKRHAGGVYVSSKQVLGAGIVMMIYSIITFCKGFRNAIANMTLSESLENKEQREKTQNQRVDPTVKTPVELGNEQGTAGHP
jgi:hypothetical protein